jgi:hypothetical protein
LDFPAGDASLNRTIAMPCLMRFAAQSSPRGETLQQIYNDSPTTADAADRHPHRAKASQLGEHYIRHLRAISIPKTCDAAHFYKSLTISTVAPHTPDALKVLRNGWPAWNLYHAAQDWT